MLTELVVATAQRSRSDSWNREGTVSGQSITMRPEVPLVLDRVGRGARHVLNLSKGAPPTQPNAHCVGMLKYLQKIRQTIQF